MQHPTRIALNVPGVKAAHFWTNGTRYSGVVYSDETGIEFDVRETEDGWNVNDDNGRDFCDSSLACALRDAIRTNGHK